MPRKGKQSQIRYSAGKRYKQENTKERKARLNRYTKYAANEREATRPPRIKRNGIELTQN